MSGDDPNRRARTARPIGGRLSGSSADGEHRAAGAPGGAYDPDMALRRAFFAWQFAAAAVLPLWLLLGYAVFGSSVGGFLSVVLLAPVVLVVELALAALFSARARIRRAARARPPRRRRARRVPGRRDRRRLLRAARARGSGCSPPVAAIGGFWLGATLLVRDLRSRVQETMTAFGRPPQQRGPRPPIDAGEYIVIKPSHPLTGSQPGRASDRGGAADRRPSV